MDRSAEASSYSLCGPPRAGLPATEFGLRTHLILLPILLAALTLISGLTYWHRNEIERLADARLRQDIDILMTLPRLRAEIRQDDLLAELILMTRDDRWIEKHREVSSRMDSLIADLRSVERSPAVDKIIGDFESQRNLLEGIHRKILLGQAPRSSLAATKDNRDKLLELLAQMGDESAFDLQRGRADLERALLRDLQIRVAAELFGIGVIILYVLLYILVPLREISGFANQWKAGIVWNYKPVPSIAEVRLLNDRFSEMAERLNLQFSREKELNEFKSNLVSLVSHEFGNGLTVIKNAAFLLDERAALVERKANQPLYRMILANVETLRSAVNNLLNASRLEAGRLAVNLKETDLEAVLRETVQRMQILATRKNLRVSIELPENMAPVRADAATLGLVVSNLLSNSIKYTPDDGRITLGAAIDDAPPLRYRVFVRDTGIGIASQDQERILKGFYRTAAGQEMTSHGFGIGLSLARQIIEAHGSHLELESAPGKGSTFSFLLTASTDPRAPSSPEFH